MTLHNSESDKGKPSYFLIDDNFLPGFRFRIPIFIILDSLKGDNPRLQRMGETWLRTYLKSYTRSALFSLQLVLLPDTVVQSS